MIDCYRFQWTVCVVGVYCVVFLFFYPFISSPHLASIVHIIAAYRTAAHHFDIRTHGDYYFLHTDAKPNLNTTHFDDDANDYEPIHYLIEGTNIVAIDCV